jgi:hypothetical protein
VEQRWWIPGKSAAVRFWRTRCKGRGCATGHEAAKQAALSVQLQVSANAGSVFFDLVAAEQLVIVAQANVRRYEFFAKAVRVLVDTTLRPLRGRFSGRRTIGTRS